jgi:hypothetical protein
VNTLADLADTEERLLARVDALDGYLGERHVALERTGIPHEYAAVLTGYTDLLSDPRARVEALKRAVFLVWYALAEPAEFTGLWSITPIHESRVLAELEKEVATTGGDDELRAMLRWYVRVMGGPPFSHHADHTALNAFVDAVERSGDVQAPWRPGLTVNRGQMGRYWRSLRHDA